MTATVAYIWYLVVAGPGGGMAVMPSAFETRDECVASGPTGPSVANARTAASGPRRTKKA